MNQAKRFLGIDHIDTRVKSVAAVESFYDRLMPELGLTVKRKAYVDAAGEWLDADSQRYNAIEYHEPEKPGEVSRFIGFIEDPLMQPALTRIAFRLETREELPRWVDLLKAAGAMKIEWSADMDSYPAIFFEDPAGTKLELLAKRKT